MTDTNSVSSAFSCKLSKILGCSPEFVGYISSLLDGKNIISNSVKEFGGKTTLTFTFGDHGVEQKFYHDQVPSRARQSDNRSSRQTRLSSPVSHSSPKKRKTPSRRKRDRERFRRFVQKKKLEKKTVKQSVSKHPALPVQCTPPPEVTISLPIPPTITVAKPAPVITVTLPTTANDRFSTHVCM